MKKLLIGCFAFVVLLAVMILVAGAITSTPPTAKQEAIAKKIKAYFAASCISANAYSANNTLYVDWTNSLDRGRGWRKAGVTDQMLCDAGFDYYLPSHTWDNSDSRYRPRFSPGHKKFYVRKLWCTMAEDNVQRPIAKKKKIDASPEPYPDYKELLNQAKREAEEFKQ